MIRMIHTADLHLDSPLKSLALKDPELQQLVQVASRTALARMVDYAVTEQAQALLIAGDLFDGAVRSAKTAAYLLEQLDRLKAANVRVFYIKGNHDAENPISGHITLPEHVHVFDGRGGKVCMGSDDTGRDIWVHGVSFSRRKAPNSLLKRFAAPVPDAINIGLLHTSLQGTAGHDVYAPCTLSELKEKGYDYWALGHVHKREVHSEAPWIVMPGIPQGRDAGEAGAKSATVLCIDSGTISTHELATSGVEFHRLSVDVSHAENEEQLREQVRTELGVLRGSVETDDVIIRLRLYGRCAFHWQMLRDQEQWVETFRALMHETGRLWLEKLVLDLQKSETKTTGDITAVHELEQLMHSAVSEEAFMAWAEAEAQAVTGALPAAVKKHLTASESEHQQWVEDLSLQGADYLAALMKGQA